MLFRSTDSTEDPLTHPTVVRHLTAVTTVAVSDEYEGGERYSFPRPYIFAVGVGDARSDPPPMVLTPYLIGSPRTAAQADIRALGLTVGVQTPTPDDSNACEHVGEVVVQHPAAGVWVSPGTSVDFVYVAPPAGGCA